MAKRMKIFYCEDHDTLWPVGATSIMSAPDKESAKIILERALKDAGLKTFDEEPYTLIELPLDKPVIVFNDGDY